MPATLPRLERFDRLGRAFKRVTGVNMRFQAPICNPGQNLRHVGAMAGRIAPRRLAPEHADDCTTFEQGEIERDFRDGTRRKADDEKAPAPGHGAQCRLGVVAADAVVDHVDAAAVGQVAQALLEVLGGVVEDGIGAVLLADGELVVRGRGGDDARAHQLGELHGGKAGAARGAEDGDGLALLQHAAVAQAVHGGAVGDA